MTFKLIIGAALAASSMTVSAQDRSQTQTPSSGAPPLGNGGNQTVLITGCVARADTTAPAAANGFVLTNARMSNDSPTGTAQPDPEDTRNTPAGRAAAGSPAAGVHYTLESTTADLAPHLGHRVEISGHLDPPPDPRAEESTTAQPAKLKVESVRMVAMTCDQSR
jgi:hypothetical protein